MHILLYKLKVFRVILVVTITFIKMVSTLLRMLCLAVTTAGAPTPTSGAASISKFSEVILGLGVPSLASLNLTSEYLYTMRTPGIGSLCLISGLTRRNLPHNRRAVSRKNSWKTAGATIGPNVTAMLPSHSPTIFGALAEHTAA